MLVSTHQYYNIARECCTGVLCNLAVKPWLSIGIWEELELIPTLFAALRDALGKGEEG